MEGMEFLSWQKLDELNDFNGKMDTLTRLLEMHEERSTDVRIQQHQEISELKVLIGALLTTAKVRSSPLLAQMETSFGP